MPGSWQIHEIAAHAEVTGARDLSSNLGMGRSRFLVNLRPPNAGNLETRNVCGAHKGHSSSYLQHRCVLRVVICDAKLSDLLRPTRLLTRHANEGKFSKSCAMSNLSSKEWSNH